MGLNELKRAVWQMLGYNVASYKSANSLYQRWLRGCDGTCYIQCIFTYECIPRTTRMQIHTCTATLDGFHGFWKICLYLKYTTVNYKETIHIPTIGRIYHFFMKFLGKFWGDASLYLPPKNYLLQPFIRTIFNTQAALRVKRRQDRAAAGLLAEDCHGRLNGTTWWNAISRWVGNWAWWPVMVGHHRWKLAASRKYIQWHKVI